MNKNILKITTILCSLGLLPTSLLAEETRIRQTGTTTTAMVQSDPEGNNSVNTTKKRATGGSDDRSIGNSGQYYYDRSEQTTARGTDINTYTQNEEGDKYQTVIITGTRGGSANKENSTSANSTIGVEKKRFSTLSGKKEAESIAYTNSATGNTATIEGDINDGPVSKNDEVEVGVSVSNENGNSLGVGFSVSKDGAEVTRSRTIDGTTTTHTKQITGN